MRLIFTMTIPALARRQMIKGLLTLVDANDADVVVNRYRASSSTHNRQFWGSWRQRGGLIPPNEPYRVLLDPIPMPWNPGVAGSFYKINPHAIDTIGDDRGDFGIHDDANKDKSPGTLGCIFPITPKGWEAIQRDFKTILEGGIDSIPLAVVYTRV